MQYITPSYNTLNAPKCFHFMLELSPSVPLVSWLSADVWYNIKPAIIGVKIQLYQVVAHPLKLLQQLIFELSLCLWSDMTQDSQHGKWTISSSDDDDEALPPSGTTSSNRPPASNPGLHRSASPPSPKLEPPVEVKPEPANTPVSSLVVGSEARQSAAMNQLNPVKYETSQSLAGKRKKEVSDGSGWALSESDDDDDGHAKGKSVSNLPKKAPSPKTKKAKVENERPPSPHGRLYYIDEPDDFFESSVPCLNDMYRFYLNKVTGLDRKYNSGALHIRGEKSFN